MIRTATADDAALLASLAVRLFDSHSTEELEAEYAALLKDGEAHCFITYADGLPVGFAQCQLRHDYVEGTSTSPVGYLEGIFVAPEYQHRGFARELLSACEKWAREMGCREFASDCELDNTDSLGFHTALGFEETNRIICFRKEL